MTRVGEVLSCALRRAFTVVVLAAGGSALGGCTLLGLGIGAMVDTSARREVPTAELPAIEKGTNVEVHAAVPLKEGGVEGVKVLDGDFGRVEADRLVVLTDKIILGGERSWVGSSCPLSKPLADCESGSAYFYSRTGVRSEGEGRASVPLSSIDKVTVHEGVGAWWKGALIGLAIDIAVIAYVAQRNNGINTAGGGG